MLNITLNRAKEADACKSGYLKLLEYVGVDYDKNTPIPLTTILESNGLQDTLWCLRCTIEDSRDISKSIALFSAKLVLPIFEAKFPNDDRPRKAIEAAEANDPEAADAADAAYAAADAAADAAARAPYAAYAAADAAADAAARAPYAAASYAAASAARASYAAADAAARAPYAAASYAARAEIEKEVRRLLSC